MSPDLPALPPGDPRTLPRRRAVLARNYDQSSPHHLAVRIYDEDGHPVFEAGFELDAGDADLVEDVLDGGRYVVEADCDAEKYVLTSCDLDEYADLLIAVGNGVLDVSSHRAA